jgi:hypothetical protein
MTMLPPDDLVIDDLTFGDLLKIALDDLPGASAGEWTLHGPVDPGITLLELSAWQFEQRLYTAEQATEDAVRSALGLLGLAGPAPARAATTVLALSGPSVSRLAAGTAMLLTDDAVGRRFALVGDVDVLPVHAVSWEGRLLDAGDRLDLLLDRDGPRVVDRVLSLLVEVPTSVPPAWDDDAADVPPPGELRWTAVGPDGAEEDVVVDDGTDGLRRSGLVRASWPEVWNRVGGHGCRLRITSTTGGWPEPARITGVHANAVVARHLVPERADVAAQLAGWLPLPGQVLRVPGTAGLLADGRGEAELTLTERDGTDQIWSAVTTWVGVGPADRVFVIDRERGELHFGDGLAGRVPRPAAHAQAELRYGVGAGALGNPGSHGVWAQEGGAVVGTNPAPATGGADAESVVAARQRATDELARPGRVVTAADAQEIALATPGVAVARAHVSPGHHPGHPCVEVPTALTVTLVPEVDRTRPPDDWTAAPTPDRGLLAAVLARLTAARLLGHEVFVGPPSYRAVRVRLTVSRSGRDEEVRERIIEALRRHLDPLEGGVDGDGWPFGGVVRPSALVGVATRAAGVEATVTKLAVALDDGAWSDCDDRPIGPRDLVWLADAELTWTAAATGGRGLQ